MAIMYALNQPAIAKNIHQSIAEPVTTPGGDCWDATHYVTNQWINENLTTYTHNRELAARLMRKGGYTKKSGKWVGADGESLTLTLPTRNSTPRWEPTVASQLSEFGIQTTVQTMSDATFSKRVKNGKFPLWPSGAATAVSDALYTLFIWLRAAESPQQYGIYPENQFNKGELSEDGKPIPRTEDRYHVFSIQAPPVGQPNGPVQAYHPAALALAPDTNPPKAEFRRRIKVGMWLANWMLPTIPINKRYIQHFIDDRHWIWPTDSTSWQSFNDGDYRPAGEALGSLNLRANPNNTDEQIGNKG